MIVLDFIILLIMECFKIVLSFSILELIGGYFDDIFDTCRMRTYYYCLMDIPNHPLRVKGLAYLQQKSDKPKLEVCTCPKCGIQLYRPKDAVSMKCTCGFVFSIQE